MGAPFKTLNSSLLQGRVSQAGVNYRLYSTCIPQYKCVRKYENADLQKLTILQENQGKSGVYLWRNLNNHKTYIGSSINLYGQNFKGLIIDCVV